MLRGPHKLSFTAKILVNGKCLRPTSVMSLDVPANELKLRALDTLCLEFVRKLTYSLECTRNVH